MQGITGKMLIAALALGIAGCVSSDHSTTYEEDSVKVVRVKGMARCSVDNKTWMEVKKDMTFKPGVVIQTGPKSLVDLCLNDGHPQFPQDGSEATSDHEMHVFENSGLKLSNFEKRVHFKWFSEDLRENIQLELLAGQIIGRVGEFGPESTYDIKTPKGRASIRGGTFMVSSNGMISVLKGAVFASKTNPDGSETPIKIGSRESYDPATGLVTPLEIDRREFRVLGENWGTLPDVPTTSGVPHGSGMGGSLRKF
jgi:hypothetical protein